MDRFITRDKPPPSKKAKLIEKQAKPLADPAYCLFIALGSVPHGKHIILTAYT